MRVLTLNLRQGGGTRIAALAACIRGAEPDVAVLTEFRATRSSLQLLSELADEFPFVHSNTPPHSAVNGVAVISRRELLAEPVTGVIAGEEHRWVEVVHPSSGLKIVGLYFPGSGDTAQTREFKREFWAAVLTAAPNLATAKTIVIGDLNTGLHRVDETGATFRSADQFQALGTLLVDAWRETHGHAAREFSWHSRTGNGFRIDHAFVSPSLVASIRACRYDQAPRLSDTTDHAMLVLDLALADPALATTGPLHS